jgi:hypothetical protein
MVLGKRQAMDSAYINANASMDSVAEKALSEEVLADAERYADELNDDERKDKQQLTVSEQNRHYSTVKRRTAAAKSAPYTTHLD